MDPDSFDPACATVRQLLSTYSDVIAELRRREIVRTNDSPLGGLAETLAQRAYGGTLATNSAKSYDLITGGGLRLQVKARRVQRSDRRSQKFSAFRSWDFDAALFLLFDADDYSLVWARELTRDETQELVIYSTHTNSSTLTTRQVAGIGADVSALLAATYDGLSVPGNARSPHEDRAEHWARIIVSKITGAAVIHHDDGTSNGMPDAIISRSHGPAPLEVVGDWDSEYEQQRGAFERYGRRIEIAPDAPSWYVTVAHRASVKSLVAKLPALLRRHEGELSEDVPDELLRLGVEHVHRREGRYGHVLLSPAGWNSWEDRRSFGEWLDSFIESAADVPAKLAAFGGDEQHMFIWLPSLRSWAANEQLEGDEDHPFPQLPPEPPNLPANVTDLWIASTLVRPLKGVLRWNRLDGWSGEFFDFSTLPDTR